MKETNECSYAGWQPVMPGLLQCEFFVQCEWSCSEEQTIRVFCKEIFFM